MKPLDPEIKLARKIERLSKENSELRAANRKLAASGAMFDDVVDELKSAVASDVKSSFRFSPTVLPQHKPKTKALIDPAHAETAILVLGDWHIGEVILAADVNKMNAFNSAVASNRVHEVIESAKKIIRLHQSMYNIEALWVPILGDMISGSIHSELSLSNDLSDPAATVLAARLMYMAIAELCTLGIPIRIDTAVGNHPRMTEQMPTKRQTQTNLDWLAFEFLSAMLEGNSQVDMNVSTGQISVVPVYDWRFVIEHGYGIKHGREENAEDRLRAIFDSAEYREHNNHSGTSFDTLIIGDQHRPKLLQSTIVNGSLPGWSDLATAWRLRPSAACQQLVGCSKSHLRTWAYSIDVGHIRSDKPTNQFSQYTVEFLKKHKR